jgi:signal transduction histidine kinase
MVIAALIWWSNSWEATAPDPARFTLAAVIDNAFTPLLAWMLLAFPEGRVRGGLSRLTLALALLIFALLAPLAPIYDPRQFGCQTCGPHTNLLLIAGVPSVLHVRDKVLSYGLGPLFEFCLAATLVVRFARASLVERRVVGPLYLPAATYAAISGLVLVIPHFAGTYFVTADSAGRTLNTIEYTALLFVPLTFLYGMQRARGRRDRLGSLVREVGANPSSAGLERALSSTLGDPSLRLGLFVGGGYLRPDLTVLDEPADDGPLTWTPLDAAGRRVGVLVHDRALLLDDHDLLQSVTAAARLAVDNERLQEEVRLQLEALRESRRRIIAAGDEARRRIERNLHDGAQQRLVSLLVALQLVEMQVGPDGDPGVRATLRDMGEQLNAAIDELRDIARGLHPALLTDEGLAPAVRALADRSPLPVTVERVPEQRLSPSIEAAAYYVVAEALTNTARYARAEQARVDVATTGDSLIVTVSDDGRGGAALERGSGLRGLADRVEAAGGRLEIDSPIGRGTTIRATLPARLPRLAAGSAIERSVQAV